MFFRYPLSGKPRDVTKHIKTTRIPVLECASIEVRGLCVNGKSRCQNSLELGIVEIRL